MTTTNHGSADVFHAHLDVCKQCEKQPFNLCATGASLLCAAGNDAENVLPVWLLPAHTHESRFTLGDLNVCRDMGTPRAKALVAVIDGLRASLEASQRENAALRATLLARGVSMVDGIDLRCTTSA